MSKLGPSARRFKPILPPSGRDLSRRQKQIVIMIAEGYTGRQIAHKLGLTYKTVETHRGLAMERTGSGCIAHLVRYAVRMGWIEP